MSPNTLCLTPGDPDGIGPEITVKFLHHHVNRYPDVQFHVIGSRHALEQAASQLGIDLNPNSNILYTSIEETLPGQLAYKALDHAIACIAQQKAHALVTGPISKHHLAEAGILMSGHTELLEALARKYYPKQKTQAEMLFVYRHFRMLLLTRHIPLSQVSSALTMQGVHHSLSTLIDFLQTQHQQTTPKIAVLGVNPHGGEIGGTEENNILIPVINHLQQTTPATIDGPFAADALFRGLSLNALNYDAYVSPYHDQGLIPFKLLAGYKAVNVTIGLPFIRTSVSHGTAPDIVGQGIATEDSLVEAVNTALTLVNTTQKEGIHA